MPRTSWCNADSRAESLPCVLGLSLVCKNLPKDGWDTCNEFHYTYLGHHNFSLDVFLHWIPGQETWKWPSRNLPDPTKAAEPVPSSSPAGTHSSESPSRSMLATYAGNLWCITVCSTSSSSFFMREDSACRANSYNRRKEPSKHRVTEIHLLPTHWSCLLLLFQQLQKGGQGIKLLWPAEHHISPNSQNNQYCRHMKLEPT